MSQELGVGDAALQAKLEALTVQQTSEEGKKANNDINKGERKPPKGNRANGRGASRNNSESCDKNNHRRSKGDYKGDKKKNPNSTPGSRRQSESARTVSQTSTAGGDYDSYPEDLEEVFSDSDDEQRAPEKMSLVLPKGRIRTLSGTVPEVGYSPKWGGPTMCLSCLQFFDLPEQMDVFEEHLLTEHKLVVSELKAIVDPKRYIEHWRQRFAKESVDKIFPRVDVAEGDAHFGKVDYYYNITEKVPEDYALRQRLAMRRLEEALSCQQREREDRSFHLQCIFCRYNARGNRSKIIHHLYMIHHLNLGSPDNLVFVREYIEHLKGKMQVNECLYCEKQFSDKNTLMDHMRKRNHREVNPKNHYYDKFYIINYLEVGKRWLDVLALDFEDNTTAFVNSDDEEEDRSWAEWQEDNIATEETRALCLLCDHSTETAEELLDHMKETHSLDLVAEIDNKKLDFYGRMKLINFIRKQSYNGACWVCQKKDIGNAIVLAKHFKEEETPFKELPDSAVWEDEENLVPMFGNDHFLWLLESFLEERAMAGRQSPDAGGYLKPADKIMKLIEQSKDSVIDGVIAEDLPELTELNGTDIDTLM